MFHVADSAVFDDGRGCINGTVATPLLALCIHQPHPRQQSDSPKMRAKWRKKRVRRLKRKRRKTRARSK
nr:hypothetical protein CFP56_34749 [Quercus suber]